MWPPLVGPVSARDYARAATAVFEASARRDRESPGDVDATAIGVPDVAQRVRARLRREDGDVERPDDDVSVPGRRKGRQLPVGRAEGGEIDSAAVEPRLPTHRAPDAVDLARRELAVADIELRHPRNQHRRSYVPGLRTTGRLASARCASAPSLRRLRTTVEATSLSSSGNGQNDGIRGAPGGSCRSGRGGKDDSDVRLRRARRGHPYRIGGCVR